MPTNYSIFDIAEPEFNPKNYESELEVLEIVITKIFAHCSGCDATSLIRWQIMARGKRKSRIFWLSDAAGWLERFPSLPRREWTNVEEHKVCVNCFLPAELSQ